MSLDGTELERRRGGEGEGKTRLLTLDNLDGRTRAAQTVRATIEGLTADLGSNLSTAETMIVRRAAVAGAMAEDLAARWFNNEPIDPGQLSALWNTERRLLETVGIKRVPRDITNTLSLRERIIRETAKANDNGT